MSTRSYPSWTKVLQIIGGYMGLSFKKFKKKYEQHVGGIDKELSKGGEASAMYRDEKNEKKRAATEARNREQLAAEAANAQANTLSQNLGIDLQTANVAKVEAGGSAAVTDEEALAMKRRRGGGTALSSTLGIR